MSDRVTVVKSDSAGGVKIVGTKKTVRVSGWSFRSSFGSSVLKDTLFYIDITHVVSERFVPAYRALERAPGDATGDPYGVPKKADTRLGVAQNFERGRMTWRKSSDEVVWQWGPVLEKYNALGRERSVLGMPTSGVWGNEAYRGGSYVNGVILWSKATGAKHVRGRFFNAFQSTGGRTRLGLPTTSVVDRAGGGHRQRFTRGSLYQSPGRKTVFALWGAIDERYRALGGGGSKCGYPTASMVADRAGAAAAFQHGSIAWTRDRGVRVNCG